MARPGISKLPRPPRRHDLRRTPGFETLASKVEEDRLRARKLRRRATLDPYQARALLRLADRIDPDVTDDPETPASSRYMREQRIRILGWLWKLYDEA